MADSNVVEKPLLEKIRDLLERKQENYVAFCVGKEKKIVKGLKVILKASSPFLEKEFEEKWEVAVVKEGDGIGIPLPDFDFIALELFLKLTSLDKWSLNSLKALNLPPNQILNRRLICKSLEIKDAEGNLKTLAAIFLQKMASTSSTIKKSGCEKEEIDDVILMGSSSRNPKVQQTVRKNLARKQTRRRVDADKTVACGAALPAHNAFDKNEAPFPVVTLFDEIHWENKINGFRPRIQHAAVAVGNAIYSFGGFNFDRPSYSRDVLDIFVLKVNEQERKWKKLLVENNEVNPNQRCGHSAVAQKEFVIIFGGENTKKWENSNSTYRFNTLTLKWDKPKVTGNVPCARHSHSAVVLRNEMFIYGGSGDEVTNDLHSLDLESFCWSTIETKGIPPLSLGHSATVINERFIFHFGGIDLQMDETVNTLASFDLDNKTWTTVETRGTPPSCRWDHCAFVHDGQMYIFGGKHKFRSTNDVFRYDPGTFEWEKVTPTGEAPSPRAYVGCVALNDQVFIFGGKDGEYYDDTFVLEL